MFVFTLFTAVSVVTLQTRLPLESDVVDQIIHSWHILDENQLCREGGESKRMYCLFEHINDVLQL